MRPDGWLRLDPRMLAVAPAHEAVRFVPLLVAAVLAGGRQHGQWWLAGALALVLGLGALRWLTTRYRVTAERMELRSGLLFRQHRSVPRDRIRTVDVTARLLHRVFGLGVLRIGTGRNEPGHEGELTLDAVSAAEAEWLRAVLLDRSTAATAHTADRAGAAAAPDAAAATPAETWASQCSSDEARDAHRARPGPVAATPPGQTGRAVAAARPASAGGAVAAAAPVATGVELARLSWAWLRFAPLTVLAVASVGALLGGAWQLLDQAGVRIEELGTARAALDWLRARPVAAAVLSVATALLVAGVLGALARYAEAWWGYRLRRQPDGTLLVVRGLLTRRSVSLEERRLRGVEVEEPLLLRAGRGARLEALATGAAGGGRSALLPPAPRGEAHRVAAAVLAAGGPPPTEPAPLAVPDPLPQIPPTALALRRHPRTALRRRLVRAISPIAAGCLGVAVAAGTGVLPVWVAVAAAAALLSSSVWLGVDRYRNLGHLLTPEHLVVRSGSLVRRTVVLRRSGIIGWRVSRSVFQRAAGLATATAVTAAGAGRYDVLDCDLATAAELTTAAGSSDPTAAQRS